jgi:hypothetical protein
MDDLCLVLLANRSPGLEAKPTGETIASARPAATKLSGDFDAGVPSTPGQSRAEGRWYVCYGSARGNALAYVRRNRRERRVEIANRATGEIEFDPPDNLVGGDHVHASG